MQAVTIVDSHLVIATRPPPVPATGEVLVSVRAAGVNSADLLQKMGLYPPPPGTPEDIPGLEFAGRVTATGPETSRFKVGDRVMAVVPGGAQAKFVTVPESVALPVPANLSWDEAGGAPEIFSTAYDALFTQGHLLAGNRLLVTGAAGGVGTAAVQLARAAGAHVVASTRHRHLEDPLVALGADQVVSPDEAVDAGPYDVVLELVGSAGLAQVLGVLSIGARVVVIGISGSGAKLELNLSTLMTRRATISGSTLRSRSLEEKAQVAALVEAHVLPLLASGAVRVPVAATFPLTEATTAYERFSAGAKLGKVVLTDR